MTTAVLKVTEIQNGFELTVQEPIGVRAVQLRDGERAWSLDTIDAIDGVFLSERYGGARSTASHSTRSSARDAKKRPRRTGRSRRCDER